jgi:hypothetical protein
VAEQVLRVLTHNLLLLHRASGHLSTEPPTGRSARGSEWAAPSLAALRK